MSRSLFYIQPEREFRQDREAKLKAQGEAKRLPAEQPEGRTRQPESGTGPGGGAAKPPRQATLQEMMIRPVLERIAALEREVAEKLDLIAENRELVRELRRKEQEIAVRDTEIEKLKRDLVYQRRLLEKEIEDRMRVIDEKRKVLDREVGERIARERGEFDRRLDEERKAWTERLARMEEQNAAREAELLTKQGFWTRFMKMLTWS